MKRESSSKPLNYVFLAFLDHRFENYVKNNLVIIFIALTLRLV